jgi:hypothetical protein
MVCERRGGGETLMGLLLEEPCDRSMTIPPGRSRQRRVGDVPDEDVLEDELLLAVEA